MNLRTREFNRSMVSANSISEISERISPEMTNSGQKMIFGGACYESGMIEVLRGIASEALEFGMGEILMTQNTKKSLKELEVKSGALRQNLHEDALVLLEEYDEAAQNASDRDAEDHFVEGFIRGYAYLKRQVEFGTYFGVRGETDERLDAF